ncbi:MAG: Coq4 family protein [Synechococcus sp.]|nr:Coq4 family protein [Synechococcus sp.]
MARFKALMSTLNQMRRVIDVGRSQGELTTIADLVDSFLDTPQMEACLARVRQLPSVAALMEQRYPPLQPDIDSLQHLPAHSLGGRYARLILKQGYDPDFFRPRPVESEAQWLTQRVASTHDIHHVVSGFSTRREGENGVLAITACQIGFPAYVCLNHAASVSCFRLRPEAFAALSSAISHGVSIGMEAQPLVGVCWEEGWERPISDWRAELGIQHPADQASYGLDHPCQ